MSKALTLFLKASLEAIKDMGVTDIVLSPGSRSTPLAILCEQDPELTIYMDVDERSAAFFALGLAKTSKQPVVCICTSGTAAANYFPAVCEAMESQIPLVILTTDRPFELRHVGAPQTMEQVHLYGDKVKFSMEFPLAEDSEKMLQYSYAQTYQLVTRSLEKPRGPVHANFPFREPLIPEKTTETPSIKRKKTFVGVKQLTSMPKELIDLMNQEKGLFLVGETTSPLDVKQLVQLAETLNWPIFSDPLANIKTSNQLSQNQIEHHDLIMNHLKLDKSFTPKVIVRIGRALLSKSLNQFLSTFNGEYILIDETGLIPDYSHQVSVVVDSDANQWLELMTVNVSKQSSSWLTKWQEIDLKVDQLLKNSKAMTDYSELKIASDILRAVPDKSQLFISNSMPIRDVDTVLEKMTKTISLYGTRGINGIDGIISSAFGMAANNPTVWNGLLIGDVSFFHSMNGLALGKQYALPLTIFVINNDGGGIFSMLPQGELQKEQFETLFGTPQSIDIEGIAKGFNCEYVKVINQNEWQKVLNAVTTNRAFRIVEIITSREINTQLRKDLNKQIASDLNA